MIFFNGDEEVHYSKPDQYHSSSEIDCLLATEYPGIVKLFKAIISQALSDLRSVSKRGQTKLAKRTVISLINSSHIDYICQVAQLPTEMVRKELNKYT